MDTIDDAATVLLVFALTIGVLIACELSRIYLSEKLLVRRQRKKLRRWVERRR